MKSMQEILHSIGKTSVPLANVTLLVLLFLGVFTVGALHLYGTTIPEHERLNMKSFFHASITIMVMFTGDGWSDIMFKVFLL